MQKNQNAQRSLEETIKPGLRNFKSKLIIERLRGCGDEPLWLAQQAHQAAFVKWPLNTTPGARAVNFQHELDQRLNRYQCQNAAQKTGDVEICQLRARLHADNAAGDDDTKISA